MPKPEIRALPYGCRIERSVDQERYDYCVRKLTETGAIITWVEDWVGEAVWEMAVVPEPEETREEAP